MKVDVLFQTKMIDIVTTYILLFFSYVLKNILLLLLILNKKKWYIKIFIFLIHKTI